MPVSASRLSYREIAHHLRTANLKGETNRAPCPERELERMMKNLVHSLQTTVRRRRDYLRTVKGPNDTLIEAPSYPDIFQGDVRRIARRAALAD